MPPAIFRLQRASLILYISFFYAKSLLLPPVDFLTNCSLLVFRSDSARILTFSVCAIKPKTISGLPSEFSPLAFIGAHSPLVFRTLRLPRVLSWKRTSFTAFFLRPAGFPPPASTLNVRLARTNGQSPLFHTSIARWLGGRSSLITPTFFFFLFRLLCHLLCDCEAPAGLKLFINLPLSVLAAMKYGDTRNLPLAPHPPLCMGSYQSFCRGRRYVRGGVLHSFV